MTSIDSWIEAHARFTPDKPAVLFDGMVLSYREMARAVATVAGLLRDRHGVRRGDRVAYLGTNAPDTLVLLFAAARLGAILVPLNWRLAPPELLHAVADSGARLLIHQPAFSQVLEAMAAEGPLPECVSADPGEGGVIRMAAGDTPIRHEASEGTARDALLLVYTSGTTGRPKGAVLTQAAVQANALNAIHMQGLTSADTVLTVLPLFHVGGLNIQTTPALYVGASVILHARFHPEDVLKSLAADRPSATVLVPATLAAVLAHPGWSAADLSSLRLVATGSSDVPRELMRGFVDRGVPVLQVYGATETGPVSIYQRLDDAAEEFGAIGRAGLHTSARIMLDGREAEVGEVGEIELKGPNVTAGYWNRPEATHESFHAGWFRTGDLAEADAAGVYWFRDRLKNVIISGGENIYPAEIERILHGFPQVREAAVVGVADAQWGETPVAVVVPVSEGGCDQATLLPQFAGRLARYKHPKAVVCVPALPRNALGKIQLDKVRKMAEDALEDRTASNKA
ncbi:class I adenylate-forming enzyme family protein [Stappia stellulata]|uniref:class I adenylate-forming enzyme family protein n=1 Tax=Stappia stellulata TaxID=71235 RepID=UPI00041CBA00|nr:AMP-binding protein [Stappia stellulata]